MDNTKCVESVKATICVGSRGRAMTIRIKTATKTSAGLIINPIDFIESVKIE